MVNLFSRRVPRQFSEERMVFSTNHARISGFPPAEE